MNVTQLTRTLVDIPSVTGEEAEVGAVIFEILGSMAKRSGGTVERSEVAADRFNVFAQFGQVPTVTFSTHMDTVPPFFPSREDEEFVFGRGSCDAKGILASMIVAVENLLVRGVDGLGILVVVGEERGSEGAIAASKVNKCSKYLVNGEPTENKLALGTKGALRYELNATGRMAHSAYPELGESAIDKLLTALERIRLVSLPVDTVLGRSTLNVGTLKGGRAPNVIADQAEAEILIRLVDDGSSTRAAMEGAVAGLADLKEVLCIPAQLLGSLPGFETTSVAYTTDIPTLGNNWGTPFLLGPGTIRVAHTDHERVSKLELLEAVTLYEKLALCLLGRAEE